MKNKQEIEQLAFLKYPYEGGIETNVTDDLRQGFIKGYSQSQEDNKPFFTEDTWNTMCSRIAELQAELNKKYTEEDLMSAFNAGINNDYGNGPSFDKWLNSLNKQD